MKENEMKEYIVNRYWYFNMAELCRQAGINYRQWRHLLTDDRISNQSLRKLYRVMSNLKNNTRRTKAKYLLQNYKLLNISQISIYCDVPDHVVHSWKNGTRCDGDFIDIMYDAIMEILED